MNNTKLKKILKTKIKNFKLSESFGHRAVGDKIEADCQDIVRKELPNKYKEPSSVRSIEDFTIIENDNITNFYDVKSHIINLENGFSMPNLISVDRLKKLLEDDTKTLSYIFVDYKRKSENIVIDSIHIKYIWELDWSILGIGALGRGQLQIKNANEEIKFTDIGKNKWFDELKVQVKKFYNKELEKIDGLLGKWQ